MAQTQTQESLDRLGRKMFAGIRPGVDIVELYSTIIDQWENSGIPVSLPPSIDINYQALNHAPIVSRILTEADVVSISVTGKLGNNPVRKIVCRSLFPPLREYPEICSEALAAGIKSIGPDSRLHETRNLVHEVLNAHGTKMVTDLCGSSLTDSWKSISMARTLDPGAHSGLCFQQGETYSVELFITDGPEDCQSIPDRSATMYYFDPNVRARLPLTIQRQFYNITKSFTRPFSVWEAYAGYKKRYNREISRVTLGALVKEHAIRPIFPRDIPPLFHSFHQGQTIRVHENGITLF